MNELIEGFSPEELMDFQEGLAHFQQEQQKLLELNERSLSSSRDTIPRYNNRFDLRDEK